MLDYDNNKQGCHFTWNPGKTWNLRNYEKKLKKPQSLKQNH